MFRIPTRIRHFPRFLSQLTARTLVLARPSPQTTTFHFCFFSCGSYFHYLYCSLHSLVENAGGFPYTVQIFNDEEQPLSEPQMALIEALVPQVRVISWPKSMGWGARQIGWIWKAYAMAAADAADGDVIARIDSDVFFFNDRIFCAVARSDADLIGDGHYINFRYCQGGCYFVRASAVRQINLMLERESLEKVLAEGAVGVEDMALYFFAKRLRLKIWMTWFMMFPDELRNAGGLTKWQRFKFSCVHFVMKNKAAMLQTYEEEVLKGRAVENYRQALGLGRE